MPRTALDSKMQPPVLQTGCCEMVTTNAIITAKTDVKPMTNGRSRMTSLMQRRQSMHLSLDCAAIRMHESSSAQSDTLKSALAEQYKIFDSLGRGSTGVVHRACRLSDGIDVALKTCLTRDVELVQILKAEMQILKSFNHPSIIKGYDVYCTPDSVVLALEYFSGMALKEAVRQSHGRCLEESQSRTLFAKLASAVSYVHSLDIVHRDIKHDNILVSSDLSDLRLIDFNAAGAVFAGGCLTFTGVKEWAAPEVLLGDPPGKPADVWAVGLCLHYMVVGRMPHRFHNLEQYTQAVTTIAISFRGAQWQDVSDLCKGTIRTCLEIVPSSRSDATTVTQQDEWLHQGYIDKQFGQQLSMVSTDISEEDRGSDFSSSS